MLTILINMEEEEVTKILLDAPRHPTIDPLILQPQAAP